MADVYRIPLLVVLFLFPLTLLLTACGTTTTDSNPYTVTYFNPNDTYTITDGTPTSRANCGSCSNVYYGSCRSNCASMTAVAVKRPTVSRVYLTTPVCTYPTSSYTPGGCVRAKTVQRTTTTKYYGYKPACSWGSSC